MRSRHVNSVSGPRLWNLFYDGILRLSVPSSVHLLAFADDVALVVVAHNAKLLEQPVIPIMKEVNSWTTNNGSTLAPDKSECATLMGKYKFFNPRFNVNG